MSHAIYWTGLLVIFGLTTWGIWAASRNVSEDKLQELATAIPAPLTDDVRQWLEPQLVRRSLYPTLGVVWGGMASNLPLSPGWHELPWFWFSAVIGAGVGATAGILLAGYRTTPLLDGSLRTVDPVRRRIADYFDRAAVLRLRLAMVVSGAGLALACAITVSDDTAVARRSLLACALGALLVAAYYWVIRAVINRPLVASTPVGLLWQKALLAKTVESMPTSAFLTAAFSAAIAIFASAVTYRDLPLPVVLLAACFALVAAASAAGTVVSAWKERQQSLMEPTAP